MKALKLLCAALAAVTMTFTAQAEKTAKAVVEEKGATLKFVYDEANYGTKDENWFSVAEAEMINPDNEDVPWYGKRSTVTKAVFAESFAAYQPKSVASWFYNFTKLTAVEGVAYWDTSKATTFYALFAKCSGLTTLDLAGLSTTSAKNLGSMFNGCTSLTTICASDAFDTSASGNSNNMFKNCTALVGGNGTQFDGDKTNGEYARIDKEGQPGYFTSPVAKAVVEDGGKTLRFVYDGKEPSGTKGTDWFEVPESVSGYASPWKSVSESVTKVVFADSFKVYRPKQCGGWFEDFKNLSSIENIGNLVTANVTDMSYMFFGCSSLTTLDVSGFDTANVTDMSFMFCGCSSLTTLDVSGFNTAMVTDMSGMFFGCSSLTTLDVTVFDTANVTDMTAMFEYCSKLMTLDVSGFDTANVTGMAYMFDGCSSLTVLDVSGFDTAKVTRMDGMFEDCSSLTTLDVSGFDTANVTDMAYMFYGCSKLMTLDLASFDTSKVTGMAFMFYGCSKLMTLDVSGFDTSNVTRMYSMFCNCSSLKSLDVTGFDTANVTDMAYMFCGCSSLSTLDLASFDTSKVTGMACMFYCCSSLKRIAVRDKFVTTSVTASDGMFYACTALVGGAGTAYDSAKTDREYARIDGKDGLPGYFTRGQMIATGAYASLDLVKDLGIVIPEDVDYAAGDKVAIKVEGLAKGLKVVATPVYEDPNAKKKVIVDYVYTIEGVPTEPVDFKQQPMFARVTTTYKDKAKTADKTGKAETLQPVPLSIKPAQVRTLKAGILNGVYTPTDIAALWPEVADAKVNPKDWSFKGWPAGLKYNATAKDAIWSYKDGKATVKATAAPYTVCGQPTKAGEYPITATWKHKLADNKTKVSETFSAVLTVWGDDGASSFRYADQAYVATATKTLPGVTAASGLPTGLKFKAGQVTGTPTKAGVFAVTVKKTGNTKETFLWKVTPATAPSFSLDTGTAPVEDLKAQIVQGANQTFAIAATAGAKVTVSGLPSGLKLVQDKTTKLYSVGGIASKPGEYFITFKTVLNGVTTVTTAAFTVQANPFTATYRGYVVARPAVGAASRMAVAEITVAAAGTVKLTYTEGKTKYTASVKSFDWNDATGKGTAEGLVLKVSSADKKLGYGDRKATLTFTDFGAYVYAKLDIADANGSPLVKSNGSMYATVKTTEATLPASQTFVFQYEDGGIVDALATVSVAYDANKATAAFSGKLYDGTAVKATVPVMRWYDDGTSDDYVFAPFLVIAKDGTVYCFNHFSSAYGGYIEWVSEDGEGTDYSHSTPADYTLGDKKFAELVPNTGSFTFGWGSDTEVVGAAAETFAFKVTLDKKENPAGVAIYDADAKEGEKPLATVTAKVGKLTGAISVSFTSKKGDKAKYAVELVWRGTQLFAGHVTRTWKEVDPVTKKSANLTAYGTAEVK